MRAAILAGGMGSRIASCYPGLPKSMIPLAGKPILQHQVEALAAQGFLDITIITGNKNEVIRAHFGDGSAFGVQLGYIFEDEPLGTGGALPLLPREDTLIIFGDVFFSVDFARFVAFWRENEAGIALFAHPNSHPYDSDIIVADGEGRVQKWASKKDSQRGELRNLVNAGLYIFAAAALPSEMAGRCDLEHDIIAPRLESGTVYAYRSTEYVKDMGTPERLIAVERVVAGGMAATRNLQNRQRAVFLDRDGTINADKGYLLDPDEIELLPGAAEAIALLNESPYLAIGVTNQPVIARGEASFARLEAIHARLDTLLGEQGAYLDDLYFCPHHPDKGFPGEVAEYKIECECRKPKPGMLLAAAARYNIDLAQSYMIGDRTSDIAAGQAAGCRTIGLRTGSALADSKVVATPDIVCDDLREAVNWIASRANSGD